MSKGHVGDYIRRDPDGYFASFTRQDMSARQSVANSDNIEEYRAVAAKAAIDVPVNDQKHLSWACRSADALIRANVECFSVQGSNLVDRDVLAALPWKIAMTKGAAYESGLPHTRGDMIFINDEVPGRTDLVELLIHEKIHVYQRFHASSFVAALERIGFRKTKKLRKGMPRTRANPDLDQYVWAGPEGKRMFAVYTSDTPNSIYDSIVEGQYEHPNEAVAYYLARCLVSRRG